MVCTCDDVGYSVDVFIVVLSLTPLVVSESPQTNGTALMHKVPIAQGDTVGVAVQQSDLPMIQFLKNGEPLHHLCINRFRGSVYPSILLPHGEQITVKLVLDEEEFQEMSPHARFGPVIVARGLI